MEKLHPIRENITDCTEISTFITRKENGSGHCLEIMSRCLVTARGPSCHPGSIITLLPVPPKRAPVWPINHIVILFTRSPGVCISVNLSPFCSIKLFLSPQWPLTFGHALLRIGSLALFCGLLSCPGPGQLRRQRSRRHSG